MTGGDGTESRTAVPSGPRHAAPRRQLRSRIQVPAGKVLAMAAVPTALLMGAGYTPTLAMADDAAAKDTAKPCATAADTPVPDATPSAAGSATPAPDTSPTSGPTGRPAPDPSSPAPAQSDPATATATPAPTASDAAAPAAAPTAARSATRRTAAPAPSTPAPAPTASQHQGVLGGLLGGVHDVLTGTTTGGGTTSPSPSATPSSEAPKPAPSSSAPAPSPSHVPAHVPAAPSAGGTVRTTRPAPLATAPVRRAAGTASAAAARAAADATANPSPSPSAGTGADALCATDASGLRARAESTAAGVIPDQSWTLRSSRLALHGAVFGGVVEVKTRSGATKRVLKFTVSSIDIGDLDMSTIEYNGKTTHVKGRAGSTSTLREGPIVMYTEKLTGHLSKVVGVPLPDLGAVTLTPDTLPKFLYDLIGAVPIPLDLELTDVKAVQAGQFGGTLKIPGMHLYTDDEPYGG
ncbi:hypothetical protein [Streptomyces sp. NPDC001380]|uniref:hypothetical protein n=1 Tax=Streptomyces sp. NPDC001380 TaxID=3364566 RepID=UPI0036A41133